MVNRKVDIPPIITQSELQYMHFKKASIDVFQALYKNPFLHTCLEQISILELSCMNPIFVPLLECRGMIWVLWLFLHDTWRIV